MTAQSLIPLRRELIKLGYSQEAAKAKAEETLAFLERQSEISDVDSIAEAVSFGLINAEPFTTEEVIRVALAKLNGTLPIDRKPEPVSNVVMGGAAPQLADASAEASEVRRSVGRTMEETPPATDQPDDSALVKTLDYYPSGMHAMLREFLENYLENAPKRESGNLEVMNTALGVILNYRDVIPRHIVKWAESKVDLSDTEMVNEIEGGN